MSRGVYEAAYAAATVNSARTMIYITAPAAAVVELISVELKNATNATNEQLYACLQRVSSLGTPTATAVTPSPTEKGDQAAGSTVKANVTASEPTYASNTAIAYRAFPSLAGWAYDPATDGTVIIAPGDTWGLRMLGTPTSSTYVPKITFRELG